MWCKQWNRPMTWWLCSLIWVKVWYWKPEIFFNDLSYNCKTAANWSAHVLLSSCSLKHLNDRHMLLFQLKNVIINNVITVIGHDCECPMCQSYWDISNIWFNLYSVNQVSSYLLVSWADLFIGVIYKVLLSWLVWKRHLWCMYQCHVMSFHLGLLCYGLAVAYQSFDCIKELWFHGLTFGI